VRTGVATSTVLLASAGFAAGGRTLVASAFALSSPSPLRPAVTGLRAATMQFGYFAGSIAGGAALAAGSYGALGATMGLLFGAAAVTLAARPRRRRREGRYRGFTASGVDAQPRPCLLAIDHPAPRRTTQKEATT
jgi:predicted MFS family arabinose efflux permease